MYITEYPSSEQKIYSRNRIVLPKVNFFNDNKNKFKPNKSKSLLKIIVVLLIEILMAKNILKAIEPIVERQCSNRAKSIATLVSNEQVSLVMDKYCYEDLAVVIKDDLGKIQMIKLNIVPVNGIMSYVAVGIQHALNNIPSADFGLRLGALTGINLLSGSGPCINVKMSTIGNVETNFKSEFKSAGINQTLHQIFIEITCNVSILTPFSATSEEIKNQILIAESIIVGDIPSSYYNFNGIDSKDTLEVVE